MRRFCLPSSVRAFPSLFGPRSMGPAARKRRRTARARSTNRCDGLRSRERNRVIDGNIAERKARSPANAATRTSASPFPREPDSLCAPHRHAVLGRSSGSWASASLPTYLALLPRLKPSALCAVRSQLPLRGSPGMHAVTTWSPGSLFSLHPYLGQAPWMGHKILWFDEGVNPHHNGDTSPSRIAARNTWVAVSAPSFCRMAD